jgi:hypothetical protein
MQNLKAYVESKNKWAKLFGGKELNLKSAADRQELARDIDCALSPENLSCDGELPTRQVIARRNSLLKVAAELKAFDPSVTMYEAEGWM